ncbi:HNH endonuclease [Achromobacter ruhlandii]|uniref:HNH endonuclease n=1 Tax=Achromobacter ruhlandii TaxID=72557 RepID=UPI0009EEF149|nr:HNH endonuclease [Achromobacter ruhlandii]
MAMSAGRKRAYISYKGMFPRCYNPQASGYVNYGARGISVCARWHEGFANFLADMGERAEGLSLDRIDVNGNYEPSNCRWATATEQAENRRDSKIITFNGKSQAISAWAREIGINEETLRHRLDAGYSLEESLRIDPIPMWAKESLVPPNPPKSRVDVITHDYLREALSYEANSGEFTWKRRPEHHFSYPRHANIWNTKHANTPAGFVDFRGYVQIRMNGHTVPAHRAAWIFAYGDVPQSKVFHVNGDRRDNRICNLSLNQQGAGE